MKDFHQVSKSLRIALMIAVTEAMSSDPTVRFAYCEGLNSSMVDLLEEVNRVHPGVKDDFDQVRVLGGLFGDGTTHVKKYLVDAVKFLQKFKDSTGQLNVRVTIERREWWFPPVLHAFTLTVGDESETFSDEGILHDTN